ncbi:hypothetical protein [Amycolatopsis sp. CA-230715]|uniref:hypothetical protein n=1 Tax=Amycolatopsis sp. CA-230715 TaxID=2745196 RepID=UPI001C0167DA|nr:hypothetical protein [Amycolatopsis sp. CA-230715]QWF83985.1 hypothetical protein HUW46_07429 [Amycolatopsis sp. CA-230715]
MAELNAEMIGRAVGTDPQISVPDRPVVRLGVRLRRIGDAVLLDGADRPQVFTGRFARECLGPLVAACDGGRTHADLARETGLAEAAVRKAVAMLWAAGVVEERGRSDRHVAPEFACFLSRLGNSTGANRSWADGADRLARTTVRLTGDHRMVAATARAVGEVCTVDDHGAVRVFFETAGSRSELAAVRHRCWAERRPLLRVRVDAGSLIVGPYVDPSCTPCLTCATVDEDGPVGDPPEHAFELAAGLVGHHLVALLSRATKTFLPREKCVVDLAALTTSYRAAVTRPGCPACSFSEGPVAPAPPAAVYEAAVALPPRRFLDPVAHFGHYESSNLRLQAEFREWPASRKIPLPHLDLSRLAGEPRDPAVAGLADVGLVLKIAFGVREVAEDGRVRRWTAAAGNIGSATAYLVSRDAEVLPVGVYAYLEREHALARLSAEAPPGGQRLLLVVGGNLEKVARKYGEFALRLVLLDAGCAMSSAREVAAQLGIACTVEKDWDEASLTGGLGLSPGEEPIVAVMGLG